MCFSDGRRYDVSENCGAKNDTPKESLFTGDESDTCILENAPITATGRIVEDVLA